jgi:CheY-like chemotaxis protein
MMTAFPSAACWTFPTTFIFIDDASDFLKNLSLKLNENLAYRTFFDPQEALKFLTTLHTKQPFTRELISNLKSSGIDLSELGEKFEKQERSTTYVSVDVSRLHQVIYSAKRFNEVAVVVVDYAMPQMNGLEFCRELKKRLKNTPIKILMLTGQADERLGVDALNQRLVDRFLLKSTDHFETVLDHTLNELQQQYFQDLSKTVIQNLTSNPYCCLDDPTFQQIFAKLCQENHIIEYYLVNDMGSYLMLDIEGNPSWFVVQTERDLENLYDSVVANEAPKDMIQDVKRRRKLLFQFTDQDRKSVETMEDLRKFLHPANAFVCQSDKGKKSKKGKKFYYTYINDVSAYDMERQKIKSYRQYLKKL